MRFELQPFPHELPRSSGQSKDLSRPLPTREPGFIGSVESLEDIRQILRRNNNARVSDLSDCKTVLLMHRLRWYFFAKVNLLAARALAEVKYPNRVYSGPWLTKRSLSQTEFL